MRGQVYANCRSCEGTGIGAEGDPYCYDCETYRRIDREEQVVPMHHHPKFRASEAEMAAAAIKTGVYGASDFSEFETGLRDLLPFIEEGQPDCQAEK